MIRLICYLIFNYLIMSDQNTKTDEFDFLLGEEPKGEAENILDLENTSTEVTSLIDFSEEWEVEIKKEENIPETTEEILEIKAEKTDENTTEEEAAGEEAIDLFANSPVSEDIDLFWENTEEKSIIEENRENDDLDIFATDDSTETEAKTEEVVADDDFDIFWENTKEENIVENTTEEVLEVSEKTQEISEEVLKIKAEETITNTEEFATIEAKNETEIKEENILENIQEKALENTQESATISKLKTDEEIFWSPKTLLEEDNRAINLNIENLDSEVLEKEAQIAKLKNEVKERKKSKKDLQNRKNLNDKKIDILNNLMNWKFDYITWLAEDLKPAKKRKTSKKSA